MNAPHNSLVRHVSHNLLQEIIPPCVPNLIRASSFDTAVMSALIKLRGVVFLVVPVLCSNIIHYQSVSPFAPLSVCKSFCSISTISTIVSLYVRLLHQLHSEVRTPQIVAGLGVRCPGLQRRSG